MECVADGAFPTLRHDNSDFQEQDLSRMGIAGTKMRFKICLNQIRVDWAELCERFGFPTWQSVDPPCPCCNAFGDSMFRITGASALGMPRDCNTDEDVEAATCLCEITAVVMPAQHAPLVRLLAYDKRPQGNLGDA